MPIAPLKSDADVTVVVVDDASVHDVPRVLQQVAKGRSESVEVVVVTTRHHRLPPKLARTVRMLRVADAAATGAAVAQEVARQTLVVVTTAAASFSASWAGDLRARVGLFPQVVSSIESAGSLGIAVYPPAVRSLDTARAPWLSSTTLRLRASASATSATSRSATVSAVLIVKNEEEVLDECLTAVAGFVDEIVVYDTGSTDKTVEIARSHGAVVVEGYWDDHFGNARNRALDHATQEWVFQVDADEVTTGDPVDFRARLAAEERDQITVSIVSSAWQGVETGMVTHPVRIFRRTSSRYVNALHEYPRMLDQSQPGHSGIDAPVKLMHSGYTLGRVLERGKPSRNVSIARRELETAGPDASRTELLSNLARSLMWDGRVDEAVTVFTELRETPGNASAMVISGRNAFDFLIPSGRHEEAEAWIETLAAHGEVAGNLARLRARLQLVQGKPDEASATIAAFRAQEDNGRDPWGQTFDQSKLLALEAELLLNRGEIDEGIDRLLALAQRDAEAVDLDLILRALVVSGRPLMDLAGVASEALIARSLREASLFHPSGALAWFEALHEAHPQDPRVVIAGSLFAGRASWTQALTWSVRARELGLKDTCALRGLGENTTMATMDRAMAWLVLAEVLTEPGVAERLRELTRDMRPADIATLMNLAEQHGMSSSILASSATGLTLPGNLPMPRNGVEKTPAAT